MLPICIQTSLCIEGVRVAPEKVSRDQITIDRPVFERQLAHFVQLSGTEACIEDSEGSANDLRN
jgi:hypothetical protein